MQEVSIYRFNKKIGVIRFKACVEINKPLDKKEKTILL
jgi:hypothetical protein